MLKIQRLESVHSQPARLHAARVGRVWRTIAMAPRLATAERIMRHLRVDDGNALYRIRPAER